MSEENSIVDDHHHHYWIPMQNLRMVMHVRLECYYWKPRNDDENRRNNRDEKQRVIWGNDKGIRAIIQ